MIGTFVMEELKQTRSWNFSKVVPCLKKLHNNIENSKMKQSKGQYILSIILFSLTSKQKSTNKQLEEVFGGLFFSGRGKITTMSKTR